MATAVGKRRVSRFSHEEFGKAIVVCEATQLSDARSRDIRIA